MKPGEIIGIVRANYAGRVNFYEGSAELSPGITIHPAPGHSATRPARSCSGSVRTPTSPRSEPTPKSANAFFPGLGPAQAKACQRVRMN